ncbi:unnamed protein product, partial [Candidula unifasciata]
NANETKVKGQYVTDQLVRCRFNQTGVFKIAVSSNGQNYSNYLSYICFDSVCDNCTNSSCVPRTDVCHIGGQCYADGYYNPGAPNLLCQPIYSATNWTKISASRIEETRLIFTSINQTHLSSTAGWLLIYGQLTNVTYKGKFTVIFGGSGAISLGSISTPCLRDFDQCHFGFTISLFIKFNQLVENGYLLNSCGNDADATGLAVFYRQKRLFFVVTTQTLAWTVYLQSIDTEHFLELDISWSFQSGLQVYVDQQVVTQTDKPSTRRNIPQKKRACDLTVGRRPSDSILSLLFELQTVHIIYADKRVIDSVGIVTGYPQIHKKPELTISVDEVMEEVNFTCKFDRLKDLSYLYYITFFMDNKTLLGPVEDTDIPVLTENYLGDLTYGSMLSCSVWVCSATSCNNTRGADSVSEFLVVKVELQTTELVISEGDTGTISVVSNIPPRLFCPPMARDSCQVRILVEVRAARESKCLDGRIIPQAVLVWSGVNQSEAFCGISVTTITWRQKLELQVKGVVDSLHDTDQKRTLVVSATIISTTVYNRTEDIGSVQVTIVDMDRRETCSSLNDPHVTTFYGRSYDVFLEGEFVLYKHKTLPYVVHAFYKSCNKRASCNCAVAIRVNDDVVVLDKCSPDNSSVQPFTLTLYRNDELEPGFRIYQSVNNEYTIYLPNGDIIYVSVQKSRRYKNFLNVWVQATGASFNKTEGLCGTFDGKDSNDLQLADGNVSAETGRKPNNFSLSWRVTAENSLYNGFCGATSHDQRDIYCECQHKGTHVCSQRRDVFQCAQVDQSDISKTNNGRFKKDKDITSSLIAASPDNPAKCTTTEPQPDFTYNTTYIYVEGQSNITVEVATIFCQNEIAAMSSAAQCSKIVGSTFQLIQNFCIRDYMITEDTVWSQVAVANIRKQCLIISSMDATLWVTEDGDIPKLPDAVINLCPNNCSNLGNCSYGVCLCSAAHAGDDCSLDLSKPPEIISIQDGVFCDSQVKNCSSVIIYGAGFVNFDSLNCKLVEIRATMTGYETTGNETIVNATFIREDTIVCSLDTFQIVNISCANIDNVYSTTTLLRVTYNSLCQTCDRDSHICFIRTDVCNLGGFCYEDGFINPENRAEQCSLTNRTTWTKITGKDIEHARWDFLRIVNSTLITKKNNLTLMGSPVLVPGKLGGFVLSLNGLSQWAQYPAATVCPWDLEKCRLGFTFSFNFLIQQVKAEMVIFSSGADDPARCGLAMWISHGRLYLRVSTKTREWTVVTTAVRFHEFLTIKFSWSVQTGLRLYLGDKLVASQMRYTVRTRTNINVSTQLTLGTNEEKIIFSEILIGGFDVINSTEETLTAVNISFYTPAFEKGPDLKVQTENVTSAIRLVCSFTALQQQQQELYIYTVTWYRNQLKLQTLTLGNETFGILQESQLGMLNYGDKISCGVSACISADCNNTQGPERLSDVLVAELTIQQTKITVTEGERSSPITIKSTLPPRVFCPSNISTTDCVLFISTLFLQNDRELKCLDKQRVPQAVLVWSSVSHNDSSSTLCRVAMTSLNWLSGVNISVQAGVDGLKDRTQRRLLEVNVMLQITNRILWTQTVNVIQVEVKDKDVTAECKIIGDPHIYTIDNGFFNNYLEGQFLLLRNRELDYEVRVFLRRCTDYHSYASCVCAVAVRSNDDVIVIDKCGAGQGETNVFHPMTITAYLNGELTSNTRIFRSRDETITIKLPSGTHISTAKSLRDKYLNVFVHPSVLDIQKVEGLCGNFDGDRDNDRWLSSLNRVAEDDDELSASWRITDAEESIYTGVCMRPAMTPALMTSFCDCHVNSQACSSDLVSFSCSSPTRVSSPAEKDITAQVIQDKSTQKPPRKCLTSQPGQEFEYDQTYVHQVTPWPTDGLTFDKAVIECRKTIEASSTFEKCQKIIGEELTETIDMCVLDAQLSKNLTWTSSAVKTFIHRCQTLIELSVDLWVNETINGTQDVEVPPDLLDVLQCASNCSGRGQCFSDGCQCDEGYLGDDCSVSAQTPPAVFEPPDGVCDVRLSECLSVTIIGTGFVHSSKLVCYVQAMKRVNNTFSVMANSSYIEVNATYISSEMVICSLPASGVYTVVVSNVGNITVISAQVIFVSFDAVCYDCTKDGCNLKMNICIIDGQCYGLGFVNRKNTQQTCVANASTWTNIERSDIKTIVYSFIRIDVNRLITREVNFTVTGNPMLVNLSSDSKNLAVQLNGIDQFVNLSSIERSSCLWDPGTCRFGLTVLFGLKVLNLKEGMYIFTSGGDEKDNYGVAMFYRYGKFFLTVSTHMQEWTVFTDKIVVNVSVSVQFSWSIQFGLSLYLDGIKVATSTRFIYRNVLTRKTFNFCLGRSVTVSSPAIYAAIIIEGWKVVYACQEIDEAVLEQTTTVTTTAATTNITSSTAAITVTGTGNTSSSTAAITVTGTTISSSTIVNTTRAAQSNDTSTIT